MGSKHQRIYKNRGNFRARPGAVAGIDEDFNSYSVLDNNGRNKVNYRFQRGNQYYQRGGNRGRGASNFRRLVTTQDGEPSSVLRNVSVAPWSKVTIINGRSFGYDFLLRELSNYIDGVLAPVSPQFVENDFEFFLENNDMAQAVQSASRRIMSPSGQKIVITANKTRAPFAPLSQLDVEVLQKMLQPRYDAINSSLSLSHLADDQVSRQERCSYMPLSRISVATAVANMISLACPDLKNLDASKNKLRFLDGLCTISSRCPKLQKLTLEKNLIENINELEKLFIWKDSLLDLNLDSNPLCQKFNQKSPYIVAIRRLFPKLQRLDGVDLPPAFKTALEEDLATIPVHLPPVLGSFFVNDQFKTMCTRFVEEYFTIFDDPNKSKREQLLQAYDDNATFTMSAFNLTEEANRIRSTCFYDLVRESHNIKYMSTWERYRSKLVNQGRLSIVSFFVKDYPAVKHDMSTFVMDISFATDNLMCLNVSGLYRVVSLENQNAAVRFFNRIFLLVPKNDGLAIINEQLFTTTFAPQQDDSYRSMYCHSAPENQGHPSTSNAMLLETPTFPGPTPSTSTSGQNGSATSHQSLIEEFSRKSGMKPNWAEKCLEDCNWNFDQAAYTFAELKKMNGIPPDAFT